MPYQELLSVMACFMAACIVLSVYFIAATQDRHR